MVTLRIRLASVRLLPISRQVNRHRVGTVFYLPRGRQIAHGACLIVDRPAATLIRIFNNFISLGRNAGRPRQLAELSNFSFRKRTFSRRFDTRSYAR